MDVKYISCFQIDRQKRRKKIVKSKNTDKLMPEELEVW